MTNFNELVFRMTSIICLGLLMLFFFVSIALFIPWYNQEMDTTLPEWPLNTLAFVFTLSLGAMVTTYTKNKFG